MAIKLSTGLETGGGKFTHSGNDCFGCSQALRRRSPTSIYYRDGRRISHDNKQIHFGLRALFDKFCGRRVDRTGPRRPNLRAAQDLINQACEHITAAQQANEGDMSGHAAKAKVLLVQAKEQIRLATEAANRRDR